MSRSPRRFITILATCCALGIAVIVPPAARPADAESSDVARLRILTYNIEVFVDTDTWVDAVNAVTPKTDILLLQEVNTGRKRDRLSSFDGWSNYWEKPNEQNVIMWRSDRFELLRKSKERISGSTYVGDQLPRSGPTVDPKYAAVVRLRDKVTGQRLSVINVHPIRGAASNGSWIRSRPLVVGLYKTQMASIKELTASENDAGYLTFSGGDLNNGYRGDAKYRRKGMPVRSFAGLGFVSMWSIGTPDDGTGTRGYALLDQVYADAKPVRARTFPGIKYSDHTPARSTYRIPVIP